MRRAFLIMRHEVCGLRYAATFTVFPQAAGRTPHALVFIPYYIYAKNFQKNRKKFAKNFILAPAVFNIASAIHF